MDGTINIREVREARQRASKTWSKVEAAHAMGVSVPTYCKMEREGPDKVRLLPYQRRRLAEYLGVPEDAIFSGKKADEK